MKFAFMIATLVFSFSTFAQKIDVKGVDTDGSENTTIEIKKGGKEVLAQPKWETQDGQAEISGEEGATSKDAKNAWAKACKDWKKEMRDDNKDNKILSLNCGTSSCSGDAGSKVCISTGTYKIKTKIE